MEEVSAKSPHHRFIFMLVDPGVVLFTDTDQRSGELEDARYAFMVFMARKKIGKKRVFLSLSGNFESHSQSRMIEKIYLTLPPPYLPPP